MTKTGLSELIINMRAIWLIHANFSQITVEKTTAKSCSGNADHSMTTVGLLAEFLFYWVSCVVPTTTTQLSLTKFHHFGLSSHFSHIFTSHMSSDATFKFSSTAGWQLCHQILKEQLPFGPHDYQLEGIFSDAHGYWYPCGFAGTGVTGTGTGDQIWPVTFPGPAPLRNIC